MKNIYLVIAILIFIANSNAYCKWEQINVGLFGDSTSAVLQIGTTLLAAKSNGSLIMSKDRAETWQKVDFENKAKKIKSMISFGENIYLATSAGVYKSPLDASNFEWKNKNVVYNDVHSILAYKARILIATDGGVYVTDDEAENWKAKNNGIDYPYLSALAESNNILFAGSQNGDLYISSDNADNWEKRGSGLPKDRINSIVQDKNTIYVATEQNGIYISTDAALSFTEANNGINYKTIKHLALIDNQIFASSVAGRVFNTSDNGASWGKYYLAMQNTIINSLYVASDAVYAASSRGLFISLDKARNWHSKNIGNNISKINSIASTANEMMLACENGVFYSTNAGNSWRTKNSGLESIYAYKLSSFNDTIYGLSGGRLYYYETKQSSWKWLDTTLYGINSYVISAKDIKYSNSYNIFSYINGTHKLLTNGTYHYTFNMTANEDFIVFSNEPGELVLSANEGLSWLTRSEKAKRNRSYILLDKSIIYLFYDGLRYSTDYGHSWTSIWKDGIYYEYTGLKSGKKLFVGTDDGVYMTTDHGQTWTTMNQGLEKVKVISLNLNGDYLYAGTENQGIYRVNLSDYGISSAETEENHLSEISIYPNPSSNILNLSLNEELLEDSEIQLFDVNGSLQLSKTFPVATKDATLNIEHLVAGVYVLKINNKFYKIVKI